MNNDKKIKLEETIKRIEKEQGKGSIMRLGEKPIEKYDIIPTGSLLLDNALGIGGYPRGRIIEIYGPESSGKTTFALHAIAEAQKKGEYAAFVDAEHALDAAYAKNLGVNIDELILSQPDTGEQALEIVSTLVESGVVAIVVIDSVAALVPRVEVEGEMGDTHIGIMARLMSQAMRKLSGIVSKTNTLVVFINQIREKVGVMYGSPEVTTGGNALKFYSTIRLNIRRVEGIKEGSDVIGNVVAVKVVKNKVAPPFKNVEVEIIFGQGISKEGEVLDLAVQFEIIHKSGAWYSMNDEKIAQGREKAKEYLKLNLKVYEEVVAKINQEIRKDKK